MEEKTPMSLLTTYDDLCRTAAVLTDGTAEHKFLKFVRSRENWRERWEAEQVGAQQLRDELSLAQQEISGLEHKLQQARTLLDRELQARKAAEAKRDHAAIMWAEFMNFVEDHNAEMAEGTLDKVRRMQQQQGRLNNGLLEEAGGYSRVLSPGLTSEAAHLHRSPATHTTEHSVLDVEDLSFDETLGLCSEPRPRDSGVHKPGVNDQGGSGKKRKSILMNLEEVSRKKGRRSNVEINEVVEIKEITPRAERRESNSKNLKIDAPQKENHEINDVYEVANNNPTDGLAQEHIFEEKTNLKSTQCEACKKRIKFGKICLRCCKCKMWLHSDCTARTACVALSPTHVSSNPGLGRTPSLRTPSKRNKPTPTFASPMLR